MGINSNTKHEKLAWEFLKQLTGNEEMQMDIFRYSQGVSVLKSVTGSAQQLPLYRRTWTRASRLSTAACFIM